MNMDDVVLSAYRKMQEEAESEKKVEEFKPKVVKKPVFENLRKTIEKNNLDQKKKLDEKTLTQAELAAKTGTWFEKKHSATTEDVKEAAKNLTNGGLIKIPSPKTEEDSLYRRVAKFLVIVGIDEAAKILPHLTEEQTERIIPEIATIQKITPEERASILEEFDGLVERAKSEGGLETARVILSKAYGSKKAEDIINKSVLMQDGKPFEFLSEANAERIKILIEGENVGVQSIVLSQIEPKKAAAVINLMETDDKKNVMLRLAKMKPVNPEILMGLDKSLHEKLLTQNTENTQNMDGRNVLAQILKRMNPTAENAIIRTLSDQDPDLGEDLRKRLFTEEDVIASDNRFIQNYLHDMDDKDIAVLIAGKNEGFRNKILSNVSKNRAQIILDEESMIEHLTKNDSERMTAMFYSALRRAWEKGDLRVEGRDEDEVYV